MVKRSGWQNAMRATMLVMLVSVLLFSTATPARAAEFIDGDRSVVDEGEVIEDDLFITGNTVVMNGTVEGDLFAAGNRVEINGVVEGNVIAAGNTVIVNGEVQGSLFIGGQNISVGATVGGSLMVGANSLDLIADALVDGSLYYGGYTLDADESSEIMRNLYSGSYRSTLAGGIGRDVYSGVSNFKLTGTVGRDVNLYLDENGQHQIDIAEGAVAGEVTQEIVVQGDYDFDGDFVFESVEFDGFRRNSGRFYWANQTRARVGEFIGLMLVAIVVLWKGENLLKNSVAELKKGPLSSFLWGFAALISFPFLLLFGFVIGMILTLMLGLVTLGDMMGFMVALTGTGLTTFAFVFTFLAYMVGRLVSGYVIGEWLFKQIAPEVLDSRYGRFWAIALGIVLFEALRFAPVAGFFIAFVFVSFGFGAILVYLYNKYWGAKPAVAAVVEVAE